MSEIPIPDSELSMRSAVTSEGLGNNLRKKRVTARVRPICQATKLLDRDPIVRRMARQDVLVMGRAAKPYFDKVPATARPKLQRAIDRIWQRILDEGR
jgi:hypothetical protein